MLESFTLNHRLLLSRVFGVLLVGATLLAPPPPLAPWLEDLSEALGLLLLGAAAFGRIWCLTFVAGRKNLALVTDGPYSVARNPLYAFSFLGTVGFGLAVGNPLLAVLLGLLFGAYYSRIVRNEERFLGGAFGEAYGEYCRRTPRWLPDWRLYREPQEVTLCPKRLARGILDASGFIWVFVLWEAAEAWRPLVAA